MSTKTIRLALIHVLLDLNQQQYNGFIFAIIGRQEEPRVRQAEVEGKSREEVANVLLSTYTESGVKDVVLQVLKEINCNAQRENFAKDTSIGSLMPVSRYGDIMKVGTTGASIQTAQQDNLSFSGVKASHAMADTDLSEMMNYKSIIKNVAQQKGLDPALIASIISRSSRAGRMLNEGWGSYGAYGLMQIDVNQNGGGHKQKGAWDSEEHLCQATDILIYFIKRIKYKYPEWSKEQQLKGGIAAYNAGDGNIESYEEVDSKTTCRDYSNDVVARAQWYKDNIDF